MKPSGWSEEELVERLGRIPPSPGVYLLRDEAGKVIYVGKAKSLRARVRQYFRGSDERMQVPFLVEKVADLDTLVTRNEKEALILENNLIKQYKPRYNIRLKDDKSYVSVKATVGSEWPALYVTRKIHKDGARYFGPFHSAWAVRASLDTIRKVFPLRNCSDTVFRNRSRPCLEYQIKRCPGPCCVAVEPEAYAEHMQNAMLFLEGKSDRLLKELRRKMEAASEELRFEEAARLRDQLKALEKTSEPQEAVSHFGNDQDAFGLYREGGFIEVSVLSVRHGKLSASHAYSLEDREFPDAEVLSELLVQFYGGARFVPDEVLTGVELDDGEAWAEYLSDTKGRKVAVHHPQRGVKARLVSMAADNAQQAYIARRDTDETREKMSEELEKKLHLRSAPKRVECFDISNFQGESIVASMVVFDEGQPDKSRYRRFKLKSVQGQDDFASMYEVLKRRYRRAKEEGDLPDLLVVDGGRGQLGVASRVLEELEIDDLDHVGLAKDRVTGDAQSAELTHSEERVFLPKRKNPVVLRRNSTALFFLQRIRDEAHRFAITYHRELRSKRRFTSTLDGIPGVGPERRRKLLRHFGSVSGVRDATPEEIAEVDGVGPELAAAIAEHLTRAPKRGRPRLGLRPLGKTET